MNPNLKQKIGGATAWSSATEFIAKLISPVVNMILARLLVPEAFGIVATITMVVSFAELFTDAGFQKYIIQHEFEDDISLDQSTDVAFWTNLSVSILLCAVIFLFRHPIAQLVGSPGLGDSISLASMLIVIAAFSSIQLARFKRDLDFRTLFFVRIGSSCIPLLVTVPLAFLLRNYWALLIGTFASQLFNAIVLTIRSRWRPRFYYSFALLKEMFSFSIWTLLESISIWLTSYIGVFIVGRVLDDYHLGLYKTSMTTVNAYMSLITAAITPVLFSALSRCQKDEEQFQAIFFKFQRLVSIFVFPMGVGVFLYRDLVTRILLGEQWMEASDFIGLWGLTSALVIVFSHFASEVYRSRGNPNVSLCVQLSHLLLVVPVLIFAVRGSFETLCVVRALIRLQIVVVSIPILHLMYRIKAWRLLLTVLPAMISSMIMGGIGYFLQRIHPSIGWQLTSVLLCIIVYFAVLLLLFPGIRRELLEVLKGAKSSKGAN